MPWSQNDGPVRHTRKANTPKKKRMWAHVANGVLERTGDEGSAVRQANAVVGRSEFNAREEKAMRRRG